MSDNDIILQQITITRLLTGESGVESIKIEHYPADGELNYLTTLGLIEAAKHHFTASMGNLWAPEDGQ